MEGSLELVALRCPRCGADLRVAQGLDIATCSYCGGQVAITEKAQVSALGADVDKRREAIKLQKDELARHEVELANLNAEISALESSANAKAGDGLMVVAILGGAGIFFDLFLFPLFYFLGISESFGMAQSVCLSLGLTVLFICLAVMFLAWTARRKAAARRHEEVLQSSEYQRKLQRRKELEGEIAAMQSEIDRCEMLLIKMLESPSTPAPQPMPLTAQAWTGGATP